MEQIEWRPVRGYEDRYLVSNTGKVKSVDMYVNCRGGKPRCVKGKELATRINNRGYHTVNLWRDNTGYQTTVHRLVAIAFIDNPDNKPQVNHIDGNLNNNYVGNLEWVTDNENKIHSSITTGGTQRPQKPVEVTEVETGKTYHFDGLREAERNLGLLHKSAMSVLRGRSKHHHGYTLRYVEGG